MIFPLVGNERIKSAVCTAINENKIPHAILIEGDKGTGKHTLANFIAMAAVCSEESNPCSQCRNCNLAQSHSNPDISVTAPEDGKKNIAVAQIRTLRIETFVKPHMSDRRVFIIDRADSMNDQSQNALLKILEEPPGSAMFILIAESKSALLETVISRCVVLTLSAPEQAQALKYIKENTDINEDEILPALESAKNNIGTALNILAGKSDTKTQAAAKQFIELMLKREEFSMLSTISQFQKNRVEADAFLKDLKFFTQAALREKRNKILIAKKLIRFYTELSVFEQSLNTNINLDLLFSAMVCKAAEIMKE